VTVETGPVPELTRVARPPALPPPDAQLVVVEASAGTGKTYFLEHRVVDLILGAGAELPQILLVTFTEKAVAELRMRIRDLLDRLSRATTDTVHGEAAEDPATHWQLDESARRRLRAAITAFDHAPIFTIHGYCHRILIEDAFAAQRMFHQQQVADEVAFDAAFDALLRERFARVRPDRDLLGAFLETERTVDKLRDILLGCARAGEDARVRRHLDPDAVHEAARQLHDVLGTAERRADVLRAMSLNGNERRWVPPWLDAIGVALEAAEPDAPPARLLAAFDELREPATKLLERIAPGKLPEVVAALRGAATTVSLDEAIAAAMLPPILERIRADKTERGLFDYDDMLQLVWRALCGPRRDDLAARLRARTPWAMIDEFQDTDPVQWNIFRTVWMHPEARGLTIVGDPKQAIYGFRGADVNTYIDARNEMLRNAAVRVSLDVNRRSTEQMVAAVNQILIGNPVMPLLDTGGITYDEPVRASGDVVCDDLRPPVGVLVLKSTGRGQSEANRAALAAAIGDAIEALRAAPPVWTSRAHPVPPPFALDQVMVLTRTNKDSTDLAAALRARGLPCALVEPEKLFQTREASELACVLGAIAAPRDRSARLRALRTRFFDVPWAELMRVVDAPDHHPLIARIFDWAQLAGRRAYETLFRRIVEDSRFAERALVLGGGERALTNTWHLIELLLAEVARSRSDLHELVVQLRRWICDEASSPDERDVQRAETEVEAIRVLTIHKAKGLEAPYVFLYGGTTGGPRVDVQTLRDAVGRRIVVGTPDAKTKEELDAAAEAENQRLAYVALTRAQIRLYLPLYGEHVLNRIAAYGPIQRCLEPFARRPAIGGRALFQVMPVEVGVPELPPAPPDALRGFVPPPPPPPAELAALPSARGGLAVLSYTRLAGDAAMAAMVARAGDALAIDPAEFDVDDSAGEVGPDDLPPGPASGLLLHDVLEAVDLEWVRRAGSLTNWHYDPGVREQLGDAARARGVSPRFLPRAAAIVYDALTTPLALTDGSSLPPLALASALAREVEFSYPVPPAPGVQPALVKGFIDAIAAWGDELWVVDYKSDVLAGEDVAAAAQRRVREHYAVQARLYGIAADRMRGERRLAGLLFAFVRHGVAVPVRLDDATLAAWTDWLAAISEANRGGGDPTGAARGAGHGAVGALPRQEAS
jgi:exodeoxyribonuclease V beta subunit